MKTNARKIRCDRRLSAVQVAAAAGCTISTYRKVERGDLAKMQVSTVIRVAMALGVSAAELVPALGSKPQRWRRAAVMAHLEEQAYQGSDKEPRPEGYSTRAGVTPERVTTD